MTASLDQPVTDRVFDPVDISSVEFWAQPAQERDRAFAELRRRSPISWQRPFAGSVVESEIAGYWAVVTQDLIREVSMHPELFSSAQGVQMEEIPQEMLEAAESFLGMDGERHRTMRKLMSSSFTPKQVMKIEDQIKARATRIVDEFLALGEGDFVEHVSKQMPMNTFYDMVGLPQEYRDEAAHHADALGGWNDPDIAQGREPGEVIAEALVGNLMIGLEFTDQTRACPRDDVWSNLIKAEVDGRTLTDDEIAAMFVLMSFAGNDTTRSTTTLGAKALLDHPEQLASLMEDFDGRIDAAIDEILRWTSPVMTFRRTVTQDTVLGGRQLSAGDWVVMFYISGNRDENVFEDPWRFDITRDAKAHVAFGGGGVHFCLGNFLAKMMLKHMFRELFTRVPDLRLGEPEPLIGNFARAFKTMPAATGCPVGATAGGQA